MDRQSARGASSPTPTGSYEPATSSASRPSAPRSTVSPDWFQLENEPSARLLKEGHDRKTWHIQAMDGGFIVKVFERPRRWASVVTALLDPARREHRALRRAMERGVPVSRPVSCLIDHRRGRSVLIIEAVPGAESLIQAWTRQPSNYRRTLTSIVARALGNAHEQGVLHADLHPENMLIHELRGDPAVSLIDMLGARFHSRAVAFEQAVDSLAQLDQSFHRIATRSERLRFLRGYLRSRGLGDDHWKAWAGGVLSSRRHLAERLARQRDRRLRRNGKYFATIQLGDRRRATMALELERRHLFPEPDVPDRTVEDWRREMAAIREGESKSLTIEKFRASGNAEGLAWRILGSPARKAFEEAHRRRHRDEPAELILGFVEQRCPTGLIAEASVLRPKR